MATNSASQFSSDIEAYIAMETLPLVRRQLVAYQFGDPLTLPKGRGTSYTATRYNRIPLPFQPLTEGAPPPGETMTITQVTATAQQWGDRVVITDVAEITIKHPLFQKACEVTALQVSETLERNTFNALMGGTNVWYAGAAASRFALSSTSQLTGVDINSVAAQLMALGAPRFMGDEMTDTKLDADSGGSRASDSPRTMPHYVAIVHPFVMSDLYLDSTIVTALSYSDINRLYNFELGEWRDIRFVMSNMVPSWTGYAKPSAPTAQAGGGSFTAASYFVILTASDTQNQYESQIYAVSSAVACSAGGSMLVPLPSLPGYTFNIYVGLTTTPATLALCAAGPVYGPLAGQATQLPGNQTVTITGVGIAQTPPALPASTVTVFPTFVFGRGAYGLVMLDDVKFTYLKDADKSDPLNQLRVVGWKCYYGTLIEQQGFFARIESVSKVSQTFTAP